MRAAVYWILAWMLGLMAMSCQSAQQTTIDGDSPLTTAAAEGLAAPPGVDLARLRPHPAEQAPRAHLTLVQILALLDRPTYLDPAAAAPAEGQSEPPLAAQRAYLRGRDAWREGQNFEAVRLFEQALRLAPNQPQILRMLGLIYTTTGNRVRGAQYLEQAVALDPSDVEGLFLLARHALDQGRTGEAIVTFAHGLEQGPRLSELDPALPLLMRFYLGSALEREGYDAAAVSQYRQYLELPDQFPRTTRLVRELAFLYRQRGNTWITVGDTHHRLRQPGQALRAYEQALSFDGIDEHALAGRLVFTLLKLGSAAEAQDLVVQVLDRAGADDRSVALLRYLLDSGRHSPMLVTQLTEVYEQRDRPATLALVLADLARPQQVEPMLRDHLAGKPTDRLVFERLMALLVGQDRQPLSPAQAARAIETTAQAISAAPAAAEEYAIVLAATPPDGQALLNGFDRVRASELQNVSPAALPFLRGVVLARLNRNDLALQLQRQAIEADPDLYAARLEVARLSILAGRFDEADRALEPLRDATDPRVIALRVRVLTETGRHDEALALLDRMIDREPDNLSLVVDKARLQTRLGEPAAAERSLLDALNSHPQAEVLYESLFELYDSPNGPPDATRQYQRLMSRLLRTIPNSRIARIERSKLHSARGEFPLAEELLRGVLQENARDLRALEVLLDVLVRGNRRDEADQLISQRLDETPDDRPLLRLARLHYQRTNDMAKAGQVTERLLLLEPPGAERARALAFVYLSLLDAPQKAVDVLTEALDQPEVDDPRPLVHLLWRALTQLNQPEAADDQVRRAIARFPDHEADLTYEWAMMWDRMGDRQRAERMMLDLLDRHPDHAPTNNGLGYTWADQGRNLAQARQMIRAALDAEPDNAAYLDSMGWVLYKQGQFEEAVTWLRRSQAAPGGEYPVILDHLGDALYRLNQRGEAQQAWRRAMQMLPNFRHIEDDPELEGLGERLREKLDASRANRQPPLAPVPHMDDPDPDAPEAQVEAEAVPEDAEP